MLTFSSVFLLGPILGFAIIVGFVVWVLVASKQQDNPTQDPTAASAHAPTKALVDAQTKAPPSWPASCLFFCCLLFVLVLIVTGVVGVIWGLAGSTTIDRSTIDSPTTTIEWKADPAVRRH